MPSSLAAVIKRIDTSLSNNKNKKLIHRFVDFMKSADISEKYQKDNLFVVLLYTRYLGDKDLSSVNRKQDIIEFLDTRTKDTAVDPDQKWIRTWNDYLQRIKYFMRWLHNYHNNNTNDIDNNVDSMQTSDWETPSFVQIKKKKTNRISPYLESELWDRDELLAIIKYESRKRNKAALSLLWDLNARNHEVTLLKVKHVRLGSKYGEAEIPHQSKTGSGPALLMCSFPYVRDWLNEHPFRNEPNANIICNLTTGSPITADTLATVMKQLRKRIIGLIEGGSITDAQEKQTLERLIKTKKWNPYCIRHSAITADSDYLPEFALRKKARWVMNSKQPARYIKARMGNDLKQKILVQNGIITEVENKPRPAIGDCPRCQRINPLENKYCSSCSYPLTPSAFDEIKEQEESKLKALEQKHEIDIRSIKQEKDDQMKSLSQRFDSLQAMVEKLVKGLAGVNDQEKLNEFSRTLFDAGLLMYPKKVK